MNILFFQLILITLMTIQSVYTTEIDTESNEVSNVKNESSKYGSLSGPEYLWLDNTRKCYRDVYTDDVNNVYRPVNVGENYYGQPYHVGKACQSSHILPGRVECNDNRGYISIGYNDREFTTNHFKMLMMNVHTNYHWMPASHGHVPLNAVEGGAYQCEILYIGRAYYQNKLLPGKIHPGNRCCYITWEGREIPIQNYEVLVTGRIDYF
ncbi:hypothetical protein HCN44_005143 [Aphidius gifuensis]|uniref:Odorant-binding protein n=1 Tax=Aphidius gifuensis TaxID=684658 RepID=A0A834XX71_APHGI|nr:uncharacterized protein LOC122852409 [Aphidius gifuensis]KAF7992799.1 hypothetical protein HCN44_005143 [Aphidius gifuensis]